MLNNFEKFIEENKKINKTGASVIFKIVLIVKEYFKLQHWTFFNLSSIVLFFICFWGGVLTGEASHYYIFNFAILSLVPAILASAILTGARYLWLEKIKYGTILLGIGVGYSIIIIYAHLENSAPATPNILYLLDYYMIGSIATLSTLILIVGLILVGLMIINNKK